MGESPKMEVIKKENSPRQKVEPNLEEKLSQSLSKGTNIEKQDREDYKQMKEKVTDYNSYKKQEEMEKEKTEYKKEDQFVPVSNAVAADQNFMTESGDEDAKLYSSESETSSQEIAPAKKVSAERERKVGVGAQNTNNAYQQMLLGGSKKTAPPVTFDDESTSDNIDDQSLSDFQPKPNPILKKEASKPTTKLTGALGGGGGHPMPISFAMGSKAPGLSAGKLGHPAAQKMGMLALNTETDSNNENDGGDDDLSAPENDDEDDFWS